MIGDKTLHQPMLSLDTDVFSLACERMQYTFDRFDHVAVSFSGGKDSTAVLNVALEVAHSSPKYRRHLPLRAIFHDEEAIPFETEQYVRRVAQRDDVAMEWMCLPVQQRNACSRKHPYWWPWAPEDEHMWCRPLPPEALTTVAGFPLWPSENRLSIPDSNGLFFPRRLGNCGMLMGIRAQESLTRSRAVRRRAAGEETNWITSEEGKSSKGNLWKVYPIYDWKTEDVWTASATRGWDYNHAYDHQEMAGIPAHGQRCSPAFGEEPIGKLYIFATCFPDVWAKMVTRLPGVGAAYRYSTTELYGYRSRPQKPAGMTWPDFLAHYIVKHGYAQPTVVHRVKYLWGQHYKKTSDPIAEKTAHPVTGISYDFLLMVAMRGDFKERKQPQMRQVHADDIPAFSKRYRQYAAELAGIITGGRFAELGYPLAQPDDPFELIPPAYRTETS
jgi:predicted phosphoadenosine phosphosulfate sulfurtransferase